MAGLALRKLPRVRNLRLRGTTRHGCHVRCVLRLVLIFQLSCHWRKASVFLSFLADRAETELHSGMLRAGGVGSCATLRLRNRSWLARQRYVSQINVDCTLSRPLPLQSGYCQRGRLSETLACSRTWEVLSAVSGNACWPLRLFTPRKSCRDDRIWRVQNPRYRAL